MLTPTLVALWIGSLSVVAFALTAFDKLRAYGGRRRIPERTLLGVAAVGGSPGLLLGMILARHKTAKRSFKLAFAAILALQAVVVYLLLR